jgi:hypothetical protein
LDISFNEAEVLPPFTANAPFNLSEITSVASGKIIQPHDPLPGFEQSLQQVGADETRHAGDCPRTWLPEKQIQLLSIDAQNWS